MRKTVAAFAILAGASAARPASAQAEALPLSLTWNAPQGCPDDAFVARRVGQILHGMRSTTSVAARGKVARLTDGRYELTLALHTADVDDTKTIAATSCAALAEAAAVVLALAIAPSGDAPNEASEPPPAPPNVEPPDAAEPPKPNAEPKAPPPKREPEVAPRIAVGLGGSIASGMLPGVAGGAVITAGLRLDRFRFGVLGTFSLRQNPIFNDAAGASFDMIEAGAFGGYLLPIGRFAIGPCGNVEMTYVRVRGFGIRLPQTSTTLWPTVVLGARAEAQIARWFGLFARADVVVPLDPPTFTLVTSATSVHLHEPDALGPRLSLGAEIVLP